MAVAKPTIVLGLREEIEAIVAEMVATLTEEGGARQLEQLLQEVEVLQRARRLVIRRAQAAAPP